MAKDRAKRDRLLFMGVALGVVAMCAVGALLLFVLSAPPKPPGPPLYPEPPIYAGASGVEIVKGDKLERQPQLDRERLIRFKTGDAPKAVLSFYEETLKKAGWSLFEKISPDELNFYWTDGTAIGGLYKANVTANPSAEGGAEVMIETGQGVDSR